MQPTSEQPHVTQTNYFNINNIQKDGDIRNFSARRVLLNKNRLKSDFNGGKRNEPNEHLDAGRFGAPSGVNFSFSQKEDINTSQDYTID